MEYTTIQKTAERWGVTRAHVHKLCKDGRIPGAVYENKHWRVPVDAEKPKGGKSGFFSASEMARKWGMTVNKVLWLCQIGAIPGVERGNRIWFIPEDTVNPLEGYVLVSEMSEKWGMNRGQITVCCRDGRIPGAKHLGQNWFIPVDATKPANKKTSRMPGYASASEMAKKWGVSCNFVTQAAKEGRIPGAEFVDGKWHIPEDAECPLNRRPKWRQYGI